MYTLYLFQRKHSISLHTHTVFFSLITHFLYLSLHTHCLSPTLYTISHSHSIPTHSLYTYPLSLLPSIHTRTLSFFLSISLSLYRHSCFLSRHTLSISLHTLSPYTHSLSLYILFLPTHTL